MATVNKIDSNITGLRYAVEESPKVLPASDVVWYPLEPNSYGEFGGNVTTIVRNPINPSRQRKKGVVSDFDASGGFNSDLTQENLQNLLQGFMFADFREKSLLSVATVDGVANEFEPASGGTAYQVGDLIFGKAFATAINNGLHQVTGTVTSTAVPVTTDLVAGTSQTGTINRVGYQFLSANVNIDASGAFPALVSISGRALNTFGLTIGEWIYLGGDLAATTFAGATNKGFCRVRTISATRLEFDKTQFEMVTETGTGKTIRIFFGRVLKNELGTLIKRRTYQLERTLGAPDTLEPTEHQAEYIVGAVPNELTINISSADKVTMDLSFVAMDSEPVEADTGLKAGTRPSIVEADAFNTSTDVSRVKLALVDDTEAAVTPLFAFAEEISITVSNGIELDKAIGVLGAFDASAGTFTVSGSITAYFADIVATKAVRDNRNITLDGHLVKNNAGITWDMPLITLGDGRPNVEQDRSIKLPLTCDAATAASIDPNLDHTLLFIFWDYLPAVAAL
jgi:hypothetical protein